MAPAQAFRDSGNHLLDRIPPTEFDRLSPMLRTVGFELKQVIQGFEAEVVDVIFPTSALISLLAVLEKDDPIEVATVGREGMAGVAAVLGTTESPFRVICQLGGDAFRLPASAFRQSMTSSPILAGVVHRYAAFMLRCAGQSIACNALHTVEARASRWLLMAHDQAVSDTFPMTHEFLSFMLGVRRQTVTVVAGALQNAGLIDYRRGLVRIRDRERLEESACECYSAIVDAYKRIVS